METMIRKKYIRKESATARVDVVRLMLAMLNFKTFKAGLVDIKGAYTQSGPLQHDIYVRSPQAWHKTPGGYFWYLTKLPYGIREGGRQWVAKMEAWVLDDRSLENVYSVFQMFVKTGRSGLVISILAKIAADILFAGEDSMMEEFVQSIQKRFHLSKAMTDSRTNFNGSTIEQGINGNIAMEINEYLQSIHTIPMEKSGRKKSSEKYSKEEYDLYPCLAGSIIWAGQETVPQALFIGSYLQQDAPRLKVRTIINGNKRVKDIKDLVPSINFRKVNGDIQKIEIWSYSDACFDMVAERDYGGTGMIVVLKRETESHGSMFHLID